MLHIYAADIYVSATGNNNTNDGTTLGTAYATINYAYNIAKANSEDDNIIISGTVSLTGQITLNDASGFSISFLSADDGYGGTQAVINNGNSGNRLFFANATSSAAVSIFTGLEFENISTTLGTGGFFGSNNSSSITFNDCSFTNLSSARASEVDLTDVAHGNISIINTTMTFTNCVFDANATLHGNGGVFSVGNNGVLVLTDCLFTGNSSTRPNNAANGGAISIVGSGTANITGTTFYNNSTGNLGGAIFAANTSVCTLTNVTMFGNSIEDAAAAKGGALRVEGTTQLTVLNSLFYGNHADDTGANTTSDIGFGGTGLTATLTNTLSGNLLKTGALTITDPESNFAADLESCALNFDAADGKVKYIVATSGDSPIDYGSDGNDVGAWDSGLTQPALSLLSARALDNFSVYNLANGNVKIILDGTSNAKVYNLLGNCISSFTINDAYELDTNSFLPGVYILNVTIDSKKYVQKFIVQ